MELHFLFSGILFAYIVVGIDPAPRKTPYWAKLLLVLVAISIHAFFAIALMQSTTPIGDAWYSQVRPDWLIDPLADNYLGGGFAWAFGEVPTLFLLLLVAVQWAKSERRVAERLDRQADRDDDAELKAYNQNFARLNEQNISD
jgi:putative copper resistance protein D